MSLISETATQSNVCCKNVPTGWCFLLLLKKWVEFGFVLDIKIAIAFLLSQINQNILTTLVDDLNTSKMHPSQFCSINVKRTLKFNKLTLASTYICLFHYPLPTLT